MAQGNTLKNQIKEEPAPKAKASKKPKETKESSGFRDFLANEKVRRIAGFLMIAASIFLLISISSYLLSWKHDQVLLDLDSSVTSNSSEYRFRNTLGRSGAVMGRIFVHNWFGISSLAIPFMLFLFGVKAMLGKYILPPGKSVRWALLFMLWLSLALALITTSYETGADGFEHPSCGECLGGFLGFKLFLWLRDFIGILGVSMLLFSVGAVFVIYNFNPDLGAWFDRLKSFFTGFKREKPQEEVDKQETESKPKNAILATLFGDDDDLEKEPASAESEELDEDDAAIDSPFLKEIPEPAIHAPVEMELTTAPLTPEPVPDTGEEEEFSFDLSKSANGGLDFEIEQTPIENELSEEELENLSQEFGEYDPKLDLSRYELPTIELLEAHGTGIAQIDKQELETNKNKIVETLNNYKIEIDKIKASIGPTVTLYEIVPAPGVRISKIKNLEDDIALSLSALGIRIIAPIPGKGTIGIEVPNSKPDVVSMRSLIAADKFQNTDAALPIAMGKTISNETFVADLAKMPHLLMAGATGQGKSVGLNAILVSLLYKKHPSQIKFVLVDPKKVELSLFNKIERHFLAKLPDEGEAIITDTSKVIKTLNSLCLEMDDRYELLKNAQVRNIKEYNAKFISRRLNPNEGHRFMPYIVLVVDEFADLIMTAGKEVETPIARLAQLARAIGIHLIIATQRPSVNIITGTIKANFPARVAFRVTSKIDSRTILDTGGAEQLIGRGDMLYSTGNDLIRIQCGFVDTPEVEAICEFVGSQQGYPSAYMLPEVADEPSGEMGNFDDSERDELFDEAARIIVMHQQGSTSLLQRKLKLGYNRAGRLIDQLESAGVIGPFEGSKARKVLIPDEISLEQFLKGRA
jgi:S-DNA-T family DNA segregation ATPase FtsK/SpoIIIE